MKRTESIDDYIENHPQWADALNKLRQILTATELEETLKWGAPCYTLDGKNIVGIGAFKQHVAMWFHQGVFLADPGKVLINAQAGTTRGLRQWRFARAQEIRPRQVKAYLLEAIDNHKRGLAIKPVRSKAAAIPPQLQAALRKRAKTSKAFDALTKGRQREYAEHIASAKQDKTKMSRLAKILPMIEAGVGLHDKYRNC